MSGPTLHDVLRSLYGDVFDRGPVHGPEVPRCQEWAGHKYESPCCDLVRGHAGPHSMAQETDGARVWWGGDLSIDGVLRKFFGHAELVMHPWQDEAYVEIRAEGDPYTPHGGNLSLAEADMLRAWWESLRG